MQNSSTNYIIGFPNQLASDAEKASEEYGLMVGRAIESEWFRKEGGQSRFYNNRDTYHKLRTYAMGEQSVRKYKNELAVNGDISYLNLDWTPVPIIPKFVDIVVNGISNRLFDVKADAVDPVSSNKKAMYKNRIQTEMRNKEDFEEIGAMLGKSMFSSNPDMLPETDDELELHMQIDYKDDIEIAEEKAIETTLKYNNYELTKKRVDEDATVLGISAVKHSFNTHEGIRVEYVDPSDLVYSPTEDPYFEDCYYFGEVKNVNITEIKKINPNLTQSEIDEIAKSSSKFDAYQGMRGGYKTDTFDYNTATLLYFCYKTDKNIVYKKKKNAYGGEKVLKKDDQFNPPKTEQARFEKLSKRIDVWYEGVLVLGTNKILKWEVMKNMVRPKSSIEKVYAPFIVSAPKMYRGQIDSLVKRMIPFADQIQLLHLKLQQVASKMIPDGVFIDIDGLSSVNLGNGNTYSPQEALNLYFQTGSVIGRSYTEEGEFNNGKVPIQELTSSGANSKISSLINMYNYNLNLLRGVTGLNEARDGSTPDPNALVGVQKLAALNSNTATRHILKSGIFTTQRIAECVGYRISDILEYSSMKEDFVKSIGRNSVDILNEIKELHLHDFGIYIELHPDEEERQMLEQNIQTSLSAGKIDIDDAIDIRSVKNVKIASQLLKVRKRRKEKLDNKRQQENIALQAEANQQASLTAEQGKQQTALAKMEAEAKIKQLESELEMKRMQQEFLLKSELIKMQKGIESQIKSSELQMQQEKDRYKEDRKDKRTAKQASQQSKLIQQRKQDLDPIDFDGQDSLGSGMSGIVGVD
jgi:hypothetical protein|tara:strand:+ start:12991 stop:15414 length:2424 start_codon:yes stop_codon:yes gene_type:complete